MPVILCSWPVAALSPGHRPIIIAFSRWASLLFTSDWPSCPLPVTWRRSCDALLKIWRNSKQGLWLSKFSFMSWRKSNRFVKKPLLLKLCYVCLEIILLLPFRKLTTVSLTIFSKISAVANVKLMSLEFKARLIPPFYKIGLMFAFFQCPRTLLSWTDRKRCW